MAADSNLTKPQIIEHCSQSLNFTPYDTRWIPASAQFLLLGILPNGIGTLKVLQLSMRRAICWLVSADFCEIFHVSFLVLLPSNHIEHGKLITVSEVWLSLLCTSSLSQFSNFCGCCCAQASTTQGMRCCTFNASSYEAKQPATGDFRGALSIWDLEHMSKPVWSVPKAGQIS